MEINVLNGDYENNRYKKIKKSMVCIYAAQRDHISRIEKRILLNCGNIEYSELWYLEDLLLDYFYRFVSKSGVPYGIRNLVKVGGLLIYLECDSPKSFPSGDQPDTVKISILKRDLKDKKFVIDTLRKVASIRMEMIDRLKEDRQYVETKRKLMKYFKKDKGGLGYTYNPEKYNEKKKGEFRKLQDEEDKLKGDYLSNELKRNNIKIKFTAISQNSLSSLCINSGKNRLSPEICP